MPFLRTASDPASHNSLHGPMAPFLRTKSDPIIQNHSDAQQLCRAPSAASKVSHAEPVAGMSGKRNRQVQAATGQHVETACAEFVCTFQGLDEGNELSVAVVGVKSAPQGLFG